MNGTGDGPDGAATPDRGVVLRPQGRTKRPTGDATRRQLLDAGRQNFAEHGFAGASVQSIVEQCNLAPTSIYHHFGSKLGLFLAVAEDVYGQFIAGLDEAITGIDVFDDAIAAVIRAAGELHREDPSLAPVLVAIQMELHRNADLRDEFRPMTQSFVNFADQVAGLAPERLLARGRRPVSLAIVSLLQGLNTIAASLPRPGDFVDTAEVLRLIFTHASPLGPDGLDD